MRFSKLNTSWGKNFVENKMPEAHWKLESIERGARIVVITPEYNPTAYRADYWIPSAAGDRRRQVSGCLQNHLRRKLAGYRLHQGIYRSALARTDGYPPVSGSARCGGRLSSSRISPRAIRGASNRLKPEQIERLGGMMVWDLAKGKAVPLHREQVGFHFKESGIDPALTGTYPGETAQWSRNRRHADLPDVSSPPAGL